MAGWYKYSGLKDGFKTDYAEVFIYGSRNMGHSDMNEAFKKMMKKNYMLDADSALQVFNHEFFDALTSYANVILPGVAKTNLVAFWESQKNYDKLSWEDKLNEHAWLIDIGPMLSEPAIRFEGRLANASGAAPAGSLCLMTNCAAISCRRPTARSS